MVKFCPHCKSEKGRGFFNKNKARYDGLANYCRACWSEIGRNLYRDGVKETICRKCNVLFIGRKNTSYCSKKCRYISRTKPISGYRKCLFCSKEFPFRSSLKARGYGKVGSVKQKFCSRKCAIIFVNKSEKSRLLNAIRHKGNRYALGRKATLEQRVKLSEAIKGEKHWNWKGGISPLNNALRSCLELKDWRRRVFQRDNFTCQFCGMRGGALEADHIKPFAQFPNLRFELLNGRTLCRTCHQKTPTYKGRNKMIEDEEVDLARQFPACIRSLGFPPK